MPKRFVMFSCTLACLSLLGYLIPSPGAGPATPAVAAPEPGADLGASAVLEAMSGTGGTLAGTVRIRLNALTSGALVTLSGPGGIHVEPLSLRQGEQRDIRIPVRLRAGEDNDLAFSVAARRPGGAMELQTLHLHVPLDPDRRPELVGDAWQYQGSVEPAGGAR